MIRAALVVAGVLALAGCTTAETVHTAPGLDLDAPPMREIAFELVSSAENSSLDWKAQYSRSRP